ncbi:MAG: hypothetical protein U0263_04625 [Polyangiaceae bacterium]
MSDRDEVRDGESPDDEDREDASERSADEPVDSGAELDEAEETRMRDLLRGALSAEREEPPPDSEFLRGVQKRLRNRSGGKFYADGWSTAKHAPTYTYLWTSVIMLAIVLVVYATLSSLVGEAAEVENQPAPVQIVFPKPTR